MDAASKDLSVAFIYHKLNTRKPEYRRKTQNGARSGKPKFLVPREEATVLLRNATPLKNVQGVKPILE